MDEWQEFLRRKNGPSMPKGNPVFRILDVCCGAGGISLGLKMAFAKVHKNVEIIGIDTDKWAVLTYQKNRHYTGQAIKSDIRHLPFRKNTIFDMIVGGPPCQGFSYSNPKARKKEYGDPRNDLIFVFADIIKRHQPAYFMFENVPGLLSLRWNGEKGGWFRRLLNEFSLAGYAWEWRLTDAVHYGVPQHRKRVIILGWMPCLPRWHFPKPTNYCGKYARCLECGPYVLAEMVKDYPNVKKYKSYK